MAATGGVRAMQSTVTVHTQPSMARPGSPEQWGFGASLASVRPGSPYEQWGSPEQPAAGDSFEQWGYSLASAARRLLVRGDWRAATGLLREDVRSVSTCNSAVSES